MNIHSKTTRISKFEISASFWMWLNQSLSSFSLFLNDSWHASAWHLENIDYRRGDNSNGNSYIPFTESKVCCVTLFNSIFFSKTHFSENLLFLYEVWSYISQVCIGILLVVGLGNLGSLIGFFSFAAWIFYGLTALSLVILRFTEPTLHRPYKVNID